MFERVILTIFLLFSVSFPARASLLECGAWLTATYQGGAAAALQELSIKTETLIRARCRNGAGDTSIQEAVEFHVSRLSETLTPAQQVQFWESLVGGDSVQSRTGIGFDFDYGVGQARELVAWEKLRDAIAHQLLDPLADLGSVYAWRAIAMALTLPHGSFPLSRHRSLTMIRGASTLQEKAGLKMALTLVRQRNSLLATAWNTLDARIEQSRFPNLALYADRNSLRILREDQQQVAAILASELQVPEVLGE